MAAVKIKISALAKDLGVDKNEMLELLQTFGSKAKSAQSSIEANELDIVFEHYTQKYQVEEFGFDKKAAEAKKENDFEEQEEENPQSTGNTRKISISIPPKRGIFLLYEKFVVSVRV